MGFKEVLLQLAVAISHVVGAALVAVFLMGPEHGVEKIGLELLDYQVKQITDDTTAIETAWEAVAETVLIESGSKVYRPNPKMSKWFLKVLQERGQVTPPAWWREAILGDWLDQGHCIAPDKSASSAFHRNENGVVCPIGTTLTNQGDTMRLSIGEEQFRLPKKLSGLIRHCGRQC